MSCIPMVNWTCRSEETSCFSAFRLKADAAVAGSLQNTLKGIPTEENAPALLCLELRENGPQRDGYAMEIGYDAIELRSATLAGLHNGLQSLKLLLFTGEGRLSHGTIQQIPSFGKRGIMLDVSRGKMASLDYLKQLADLMSQLNYNVLQLYTEDKLALSKHPLIGSITGAYTREQIMELDEYCAQRFIELQPCIQTYSHMHGILRLPGYSHMAENEVLFSLAAGNEDVYKFFEDEFEEVLPWFRSKCLNINMDEAYDLGTGYSREAVEQLGKGNVFIQYIQKVIEIARRHGAKTIQMWGDVANKYPELIDQLPEDVILMDWNYNPQEDYPSIEKYPGFRREFWAGSGVSTWNSLFPRVYNSYVNLIGYAAKAYETGAEGYLVTDWGDYGHMQPLGMSLYGYILGAQMGFHADRIQPETFENAIWPVIFPQEETAKAFRLLMDSNMAPNIKTGFKTMTVYAFFDDMLDGLSMHGNDKYPKVSREAYQVLEAKGAEALELLTKARESVRDAHFPDETWKNLFGDAYLRELQYSAWTTQFTGKKGQLAYRILDAVASSSTKPDDLLGLICEVRLLYAEFQKIREEFRHVWCLRAEPLGMETTLSLFDRAGVQMSKVVAWMELQREALIHHGAMDVPYTGAQGYGVLWTSDFKNMWDRAYPWQ